MKFKTIFILFNVVIVFSFLIIYLMPLFMLGWEFTSLFWAKNWVLPIIFIVVLAGLNVYFGLNKRLFELLEKEDWPGVMGYLEVELYEKGRITKQNIRILINAYLVLSKPYEIYRLETFLREKKPEYRREFVLALGVPYILENNPRKMEAFFEEFLDLKGDDLFWVRWDYGFALFLGGKRDEAMKELDSAAASAKDPVLLALSGYLLESFSQESEAAAERVREIRDRLKKKYSREQFDKEVEKGKTNVQTVILIRLVQDAVGWLFDEGSETVTEPQDQEEAIPVSEEREGNEGI